MRKLAIIFLFVVWNTLLQGQTNLFLKVKKAIQETHPEISLENKLIAVTVWSASDQESREANKQFNRVYTIYEFAKLKGGLKGLVCVAINKDAEEASILLSKDGATKLIQLNKINNLSDLPLNIVFDEQGKEVYKNITSDKVFESINKLITR